MRTYLNCDTRFLHQSLDAEPLAGDDESQQPALGCKMLERFELYKGPPNISDWVHLLSFALCALLMAKCGDNGSMAEIGICIYTGSGGELALAVEVALDSLSLP